MGDCSSGVLPTEVGLASCWSGDGCSLPETAGDGEEFGISDQENYLLRLFVRLLESAELNGSQLIAAGRGFAGFEGAHRIDLLPRR